MAFAEQFIYRVLRHFGLSPADLEGISPARQRDARPEAEQLQASQKRAPDCMDNSDCYNNSYNNSHNNSKNDWRTDRISDPDLPRAISAHRAWRYRSGTPVRVIRIPGSALIGYPCS